MINVAAKKFYLTTAIPYVNAAPHLGHALEFVQADVIARFHRLLGRDVALTTGADENSLKNVHAAEAKGITPAKLCEQNAAIFKETASKTGLSFTSFIRSSIKEEHWLGVHALWQLCKKSGDIYKKNYRGLYCVGCETFYDENELPGGVCPEHKTKPDVVEEENYFFKLSKYQKKLEQLIESGKLQIIPETRKNEVLSFIRSGLQDFSISRSVARAKGWGVPVPNDKEQIIYVWMDALTVYLTGIGYGKDEAQFKKYWPANVHVIGKGIIRFHAIYWPAILLSAKLPLPKSILVHGYITVEGQKMSKSLGNIVDPSYLMEKYGVDELRYCLLSEISTFEDGDFSEKVLIDKNNAELLANLGNLVNRTLVFIKNNFGGEIPEGKLNAVDKQFISKQAKAYEKIRELLDQFKLKEAIDESMLVSKEANRYFQENAPWQLVKTDKARAAAVLYLLANQVKDLAILFGPFLPHTSNEIFRQLGIEEKQWKDLSKLSLPKNHAINEPKVIFKKIEAEKKEEMQMKAISFADLDIEIGEILSVEKHPNADKLYVEKIKLGDGERQLVSGLVQYYSPDQLLGKKVMIVKNLAPAKLRGVESQGMLLVAQDKENVEVLTANVLVGTKITASEIQSKPKQQLSVDEFFKIKLEIKDNLAYADGKQLFAGKQALKTEKIKDGKIA